MKFKAISLQIKNASQEQMEIVIAWLTTSPVESIEEHPGTALKAVFKKSISG